MDATTLICITSGEVSSLAHDMASHRYMLIRAAALNTCETNAPELTIDLPAEIVHSALAAFAKMVLSLIIKFCEFDIFPREWNRGVIVEIPMKGGRGACLWLPPR